MAYGVLIESSIQAKDIDALNRFAVSSTTAVAGGGLVALTAPTTQGEDRWTATVPATGALTGLYMAYNPSGKYTVVNGKYFAGLSADPRDYTNVQSKSFTVFKPKVGDEIVITVDAVESASQSAVVAGDFLEAKNAQTTLTRVASATGATANTTSFRVEWVGSLAFPQGAIGNSYVKAFKAVCVQE